MLNQNSIFGVACRILLVITIGIFMNACSDNPVDIASNESTGITELTVISRPQTAKSLQKIVTDATMIYRSQGGVLEIESGDDFELIEMINKAPNPITTWELKHSLLNASPLSAKVLEALCENTDLRDDYWMIQVLLQNSPLRKNVLDKIIEKNFITHNQTYWMKEVLVASSPLPQNIMNIIYSIALQPSERNEVFAAQIGQRQDENSYNNAGGGLQISLTIPPYSIDENTYLSMSTDDVYLTGSVYMTFGPHGTLFSPPALLDFKVSGLDLTGIDPELVDIYYDNEEAGFWELMPSRSVIVDVEAGYIEVEDAEFSHFSRYAIGMR